VDLCGLTVVFMGRSGWSSDGKSVTFFEVAGMDGVPNAAQHQHAEVENDLDLDQYFLAHVEIDTSRFAAPVSHP
jgi:hypothetical protein